MQYSVAGVSVQNRRYLNAYGGLKFLNLNDLIAVLIQDIIEQQNTDKMFTHTHLFWKMVLIVVKYLFYNCLQMLTALLTALLTAVNSKISQKRSIL